MDLQELGITKEELVNRLVQKLADEIMQEKHTAYDDDGEYSGSYSGKSRFAKKLAERLDEVVDAKVETLITNTIEPDISTRVDELVLQATNRWGEKRGHPVTLAEYVTGIADAYLNEPVDWEGRTKADGGYGWKAAGPRMMSIVDKYLQHHVAVEIQTMLKKLNEKLLPSFKSLVSQKLSDIAKDLNIQVTVRNR